jgi:hypothetical protein
MFYLACTRFNNITYDENIIYRNKYNEIAIYGSVLKIREIYPIASLIFIAEMNNEKNMIEGIGLIKNLLVHDRRHNIYENNEYNRYIYRGKHWLSREQIMEFNPEILTIFDDILFKGKSHLKCRIGIRILTDKLFSHWDCYELRTLKNMVKEMFQYYFKNKINKEIVEKKEIVEEEKEGVYFDIIPKKRKRRGYLTNKINNV